MVRLKIFYNSTTLVLILFFVSSEGFDLHVYFPTYAALIQKFIFFLCLLNPGCYRNFPYAFEGAFFSLPSTLVMFFVVSQLDLSADYWLKTRIDCLKMKSKYSPTHSKKTNPGKASLYSCLRSHLPYISNAVALKRSNTQTERCLNHC